MATNIISVSTIYHRLNNANNLVSDIKNVSNSYYAFIGKSDAWATTLNLTTDTVPTPIDASNELREAFGNMIAMKKLTSTDVYKVIPRYDWISGGVYDEWDDADDKIFGGVVQVGNTITEYLPKRFYIITDLLMVYKCIRKGTASSTVKPTHTNTSPTSEADGYVWMYMYSLSGTEALNYTFDTFIPVRTILTGSGTSEEVARFTHQTNAKTATKGKVYNIKVTNGGSGYTSAPTVSIVGQGTGATATATITSGAVTSITITANGSGYINPQVTFSGGGGTGATARVIMPPRDGHGSDSELELGAFNVIVIPKFEYNDGSGDFIIDNDFRQVGLIKNPYNIGTTTISTATTLRCLKKLNLSSHSGFVKDGYVTGSTSGAIGFIDFYDSTNNTIWYHQNSKTGFKAFQNSENITGKTETGANAGTGTLTSSAIVLSENEPYTGDIQVLSNNSPVLRNSTQIEICPIVIEF